MVVPNVNGCIKGHVHDLETACVLYKFEYFCLSSIERGCLLESFCYNI